MSGGRGSHSFGVDRFRAAVVEPVVRSVIDATDLETLDVTRDAPAQRLTVELTARGERFVVTLWEQGWPDATPRQLGERLADLLEDWICETRFAWGQQRLVPDRLLEALPVLLPATEIR